MLASVPTTSAARYFAKLDKYFPNLGSLGHPGTPPLRSSYFQAHCNGAAGGCHGYQHTSHIAYRVGDTGWRRLLRPRTLVLSSSKRGSTAGRLSHRCLRPCQLLDGVKATRQTRKHSPNTEGDHRPFVRQAARGYLHGSGKSACRVEAVRPPASRRVSPTENVGCCRV